MSNRSYILRPKNYIFRPLVATIRFFSFKSTKAILYNSRVGVFDEEISTSKHLLEHSTFILGVWVNHVIIHKSIILYYLLSPRCRVLLEKLTGLQLVKKFPAFLWNPKVHYRTHKRPPLVTVLGQPNPVHIPTSHLLEIHPNISTHLRLPMSPQWSLSLRFSHQDPIRPSLLTHTRHMPSPSHSSRFYHPHNIR